MVDSFIQVPPDGSGKRLYTHAHQINTVETHIPGYMLMDAENPDYHQRVDASGQAYFRFAEGTIGFDPFGNARVGEATMLGAYEHSNDSMSDLYQDIVVTGGSIVWSQPEAKTTLGVTGASGASASRTTNRWHYYQAGVSNLNMITCYLSDSGKAGNTRRWGPYSDDEGLFFELEGTTLSVARRLNSTGSVVDTKIAQANWNGDKIDGTGISGMLLDLTKANFFWIDYAWLGVGIARFGILASDGSRVVCHTFQNPNSNPGVYMGKGSLPIRYENFNTGVTAGTSELHSICAAVYASARVDYTFWRFSDIETAAPKTVTTDTYLLSMRPTLTLVSGQPNRVGVYPESLNVFVTGGSVKLSIVDDAVLTTPTWVDCQSLTQYDVTAAGFTGGEKFKSFYVGPGASTIDLGKFYEMNDEGYHILADGTDTYRFTLIATKLDGTTVTVMANLNYKELI